MRHEIYLEELKEEPPKIEYVISLPIKDVVNAITGWGLTKVKFNDPLVDYPEDEPDEELDWLWSGVEFNLKEFFIKSNGTEDEPVTLRTFERLQKSYAIYPDGTINKEVIPLLIRLKSKENNK